MTSTFNHAFCVDYAKEYGIEESILISHFQYWIKHNQALKRNFHDGHTWMYQTQSEIAAHFPYLSEDKVFRTINSLVKKGIIIKGNHNKMTCDRTIWYAFENEQKFVPHTIVSDIPTKHSAILRNGFREIAGAIPNTKTNTKEQQQRSAAPQVVVSTKKDIKKERKPKIYQCLEEFTFEEIEKVKITSDFSEETVQYAIQHMKARRKDPNCQVAYLKWACGAKPSMNIGKDVSTEKVLENRKKATKYDNGVKKRGASVDAGPKSVFVGNPAYPEGNYDVNYEDTKFDEKFEMALIKHGFKEKI